jgi:hypothetical protein
MIMLFNQLLDMPQLSGGWNILAKFERNKLFLRIEDYWNFYFSS